MAKSKKEVEQITLNELINDELSTRTDTLKILTEEFKVYQDISTLFQDNIKANKRQAGIIGDIVDATKSVFENQKSITEENFQQVDLSKLERDLVREGVQDTGQIIAKLKEKQNIQKETNRIVNLQANTYKSIGDSIDGFIQKIPGIGGILSDVLGTNELGKEMSDSFRTSIEQVFAGGGFGDNIQQGMVEGATSGAVEGAISKGFFKGSKMGSILGLAGLGALVSIGFQQGLESLGPINTVKRTFFGGAFDGLREAFGNVNKASFANLFSIKRLGFLFGISADESAKILQAQTEISGISDKQARTIQTQISRFAALRGVLPKDVIGDLANNTELFAKFAQDGGTNLGLAAVQAKQLGLSLSTVGTIAESVLDFQTSIESELQASLLIGRQLNLNRARELALAGDLAGLQQEVVRLVGSEQELNRLNVIQRKSLANALGITVAELGRLAGGEVELGSTEVQQNTQAVKALTLVIGANVAARGATALIRGGGAFGSIANTTATALGTSRLASSTAIFAGRAAAVLGPIGILVSVATGIYGLVSGIKALSQKTADSNDLIVGNTRGNQFTPFSSTEALAS
jgi:hypothetical protein